MSEQQCLWCGGDCVGGMDGVCRDCWEKYQFSEQEQPPTDMDIWNDLQRQVDQLRAENERLREALGEIAEDNSYREDTDNEVGWHIDNAYEVMNKLKLKSKQALKEVTK